MKRTCAIADCEKDVLARGWCGTHYARWRKKGSPHAPGKRLWTLAEDLFIRDNPDLTPAQVGDVLGRTPAAVHSRRHDISRNERVDFHTPNKFWRKSPHAMGLRSLLCKTCHKCGLLLDAAWFAKVGRQWQAACRSCESRRQTGVVTPETRARQTQLYRITQDRAERKGQTYTERDLEILADPTLSLFQMALATQRTLGGVAGARQRYLPDDKRKVPLGEPSESQWVIQLAEPVRRAFTVHADQETAA